MKEVVIVLDNLRIGGFQRLALDQAYAFSESGQKVSLLVLEQISTLQEGSFATIEKDLLRNFEINIVWLGNKIKKQTLVLNKTMRLLSPNSILISHSLRATAIIGLSKSIFRYEIALHTTIHQLPTLSSTRQRFQRFFYAQLTDYLFAYSSAVRADWVARTQSNIIFKKMLFRKPIHVLRNGIYLNRLPNPISVNAAGKSKRLIFLGRNTGWKGIDTFIRIAAMEELSGFQVLIMVPSAGSVAADSIPEKMKNRVSIVAGKSIASFEPSGGDVHLYPANYGADAKFVESVSLNCLELACLGVPTLLTRSGLSTWPELSNVGIFYETDWTDLRQIAHEIISISDNAVTKDEVSWLKSVIDIQNQIGKYLGMP